MASEFYDSGLFYGDGTFYLGGDSGSDSPIGLSFYRTSQDNVYVFYWTFNSSMFTPALASFDYELQIDQVDTFDSPSLSTFTSSTAITYQDGNVWKGFAIPVAPRINATEQIWYARVSIIDGISFGWSETLIWTIPQSWQQQTAETLMLSLPDAHVYGKGDLLLPVEDRNSNLYVVENMYANQFDAAYYENFLTQTDNFIALCRDENLYSIYGVLFDFPKPVSMVPVDYRGILRALMSASLVGSTNGALDYICRAFTGITPLLIPVRDFNEFFLSVVQDDPITPVSGQTIFNTTYPFLDATLVIENLTTGLIVPDSDYESDGINSSWTLFTPTTDVLQATYDISANPPLIFDSLEGATTLTGTVTFTNDSVLVTGAGTLFLSELAVGDQISDEDGIYIGTILSIDDDENLTLVDEWFGITESISNAIKLQYTDLEVPPPILWTSQSLAFAIEIDVRNPAFFTLDLALIEKLCNLLLPAYIKSYYIITN